MQMAKKAKSRKFDIIRAGRCPKCGRFMDKVVAWICKKHKAGIVR